jgi:glutamyl-tRNA reductase
MHLLVAGFRYKNAPVEIREQFSFKEEALPRALKSLLTYPSIKEAVILSTCNRTEIYTLVADTEIASGSIVRFLADFHSLNLHDIRKYMFTLMHEDTVRQIYKVTAGMDSMILGENEITHQVKKAFSAAQETGTTGTVLEKLFTTAFATNKKIRTQTCITSVIDNVSSAAIELARIKLGSIEDKQVAIIGAGTMASLALKHLIAKYDHKKVVVLNRSEKPLQNLYDNYKIPTGHINKLKEVLENSDALFVCTAAPHFIVRPEHIPASKPLVIVDISVPRNVDSEVDKLPNVSLFNTDDIHDLINQSVIVKEEMLSRAEEIVKEETEKFTGWMINLDIIPTIVKIREKLDAIRQAKVDKMRQKTCPFSHQRCQLMEELSKQLVKTILHDPTVRIKATQGHEELYQTAKLLNEIFDLNHNEAT